MEKPNFRSVNRILGTQPKIGPLMAHQIIPFVVIFVVGFIAKQIFKFTWLDMVFLDAVLIFSVVILFGKKSWQLICRMYNCPYIVRGCAIYISLWEKVDV